MCIRDSPKAPKGFFAGISGIKSGVANIIDAGKTFKTLGPSQVKDEIQIAKHELKTKGIAVGKGAAFFGVAAVFGLFLIIALVAAAILGLGTVMPLSLIHIWLSACRATSVCVRITCWRTLRRRRAARLRAWKRLLARTVVLVVSGLSRRTSPV